MIKSRPPSIGNTRVVLIDGPAGSGKTTLAGALAHVLTKDLVPAPGGDRHQAGPGAAGDVQTLHGDDMYEGWDGLPRLGEVLLGQVIEPLVAGKLGQFQVWDWHAGKRAQRIEVRPREFLIIEGVGVAMARARAHASVVVWVEAPMEVRLQRLLARDGEELREELMQWQLAEADHFAKDGTRAAADVLVTQEIV